jgi:alcohol dehydrogenase class IV
VRFEFATATRILFGAGTLQQVGLPAARLGNRAMVVTGRMGLHATRLLELLQAARVTAGTYPVSGEPTVDIVRQAVEHARGTGCDLVIGLGGGSAIDSAKAIAALVANPGDPLDYLEVIGRGQPLTRPSLPVIAIPTTAGTGAEVTRNAVLASPEHRVKVSLRSPWMLPSLAVVDPELTHSMPPALTASTGLDALTQLVEPFVSRQANPLTDGLCREGLTQAAWALAQAYNDGDDTKAREAMALASLLGGLALANAKLGAVHGMAGVLGGRFSAPHGALCARLLPGVWEANRRALQTRAPDSPALERYGEAAQLLTGNGTATAADGGAWIEALCKELQVPPLSGYGLAETDLPAVVAQSQLSSSMQGNPIPLTDAELTAVLRGAL